MDYTNQGANYTREELVEIVKKQMSLKRFQHVLRVEDTALKLAKIYNCDEKLVSLAALLHDYGKERSNETYYQIMEKYPKYESLKPYGNNIWHGILGAILIKEELNIDNKEVLHAIASHTIGAVKMSLLDKIIFIADYIEPGRDFPLVEEARVLAYNGKLDLAVKFAMKNTLQFLISKEQLVYPETIKIYNVWVANLDEKEDIDGK